MNRPARLLLSIFLSCGISIAQMNDRIDRQSSQSQMTSQSISTQLPSGKIIQDGPVDPKEYVVGPGDIFNVNIWATTPLSFQIPVTPEGSVVIPTVGEIFISGKSLFDAKELALKEIRKKYISGNASFTLYVPREFIVSISGMILNEGSYTVQATQRVDALLQMANNKMELKEKSISQNYADTEEKAEKKLSTASRRNIRIVRRNGSIVVADIEKFLATQNPVYNPLLRDGDVIIVPPSNIAKDYVGVHGAVAKEGIYEFVEGDSLFELIAIAGGVTSYADSGQVLLVRNTYGEKQMETLVDLTGITEKKSSDIALQIGDRIIVKGRHSMQRGGVVSVEGEVFQPGSYPIVQDSTTLREIVQRAGGFTQYAMVTGGKVIRLPSGTNYKTGAYQLLRKGSTTSEDTAYFNNEILLKTKGELVSADFAGLFVKNDTAKDVTLRDGDRIIIPAKLHSIYVFGEVRNPGNVTFASGKEMEYYLQLAGGMTDHAQTGDIRIVKASTRQWLIPSETTIEEGDYIWVPKEPYRPFTYYLTVYSQVFGIVGTVATLFLLTRRTQ